jgi:SAM-dependent methyltransferase
LTRNRAGTNRTEHLSKFVTELTRHRSSDWAWQNYKQVIKAVISLVNAQLLVEIGGGRWPLLDNDEIISSNIRYLVNDISEKELALAPDYVEKICFDIAHPSDLGCMALNGQVDFMFSKMLFEHVSDSQQAYTNIYSLLSPGGLCLNFHPVLYSPPFLANWILPENFSARLLRLVPSSDGVPKHPARYDHCVINRRERERLLDIGYREVWQVPFWYHGYFRKIPGLYHIDLAVAKFADRHSWTALASYCYTLVLK